MAKTLLEALNGLGYPYCVEPEGSLELSLVGETLRLLDVETSEGHCLFEALVENPKVWHTKSDGSGGNLRRLAKGRLR